MSASPEQRRLIRRIAICFALIVVLLPAAAITEGWTLLMCLPLAAVALHAALRLRRTPRG